MSVQAALEREELQAAGDTLDTKITQCEAEVSWRTPSWLLLLPVLIAAAADSVCLRGKADTSH
jgi:hypothetical protein